MLNSLTFRHFFLLPIASTPKKAKKSKMQESAPWEQHTFFKSVHFLQNYNF